MMGRYPGGPTLPPDDPPPWLVGLAVAALLASGAATADVAWRLSEAEVR